MPQEMTPLGEKIRRLIALDGPMSIANYMRICLTDREHGYYTSNDGIGATGDFITAPEISQLFGELIGVWCVDIWQKMGKPDGLVLIELGPGKGTLISDCLRTISALAPDMLSETIHLLEINPHFQKMQEEKLKSLGKNAAFIKSVEDLPHGPSIIMGNEFLDALPAYQFQFQQGQWFERCVGLDDNENLTIGLQPARGINLPEGAKEGAIFEFSRDANRAVRHISTHLNTHGGASLFIDYGHLKSGFGDTFQAMNDHSKVGVLSAPGASDLTFHVDFAALEKTASGQLTDAIFTTTQGQFLLQMGLLERAGQLGASADHSTQETIAQAVERLAAPDQMGDLFKVMAMTSWPDGRIIPHGFT